MKSSKQFSQANGVSLLEDLKGLRSKSDHVASLSFHELLNLHGYVNHYGYDKPCLLQQVWCRHPHAGTSTSLPTVIANSALVFSPVHWRWMTPYECLLAQGFPAYKRLAPYPMEHCPFWVNRRERRLPERARAKIIQQSGDAMNTNMIGAGMVWALLCCEDSRYIKGEERGGRICFLMLEP
eukprot:3379356-Pyramimonas_sp.AAC.1